MAKGAGEGWLFEEGDNFKYLHQREATIRGRRLIEGRLLFEEIRYLTCASSTGPSSLALVFATCTSPTTHLICPPPPPTKKKKKLASPLFFISPGHYSRPLLFFRGREATTGNASAVRRLSRPERNWNNSSAKFGTRGGGRGANRVYYGRCSSGGCEEGLGIELLDFEKAPLSKLW